MPSWLAGWLDGWTAGIGVLSAWISTVVARPFTNLVAFVLLALPISFPLRVRAGKRASDWRHTKSSSLRFRTVSFPQWPGGKMERTDKSEETSNT